MRRADELLCLKEEEQGNESTGLRSIYIHLSKNKTSSGEDKR